MKHSSRKAGKGFFTEEIFWVLNSGWKIHFLVGLYLLFGWGNCSVACYLFCSENIPPLSHIVPVSFSSILNFSACLLLFPPFFAWLVFYVNSLFSLPNDIPIFWDLSTLGKLFLIQQSDIMFIIYSLYLKITSEDYFMVRIRYSSNN